MSQSSIPRHTHNFLDGGVSTSHTIPKIQVKYGKSGSSLQVRWNNPNPLNRWQWICIPGIPGLYIGELWLVTGFDWFRPIHIVTNPNFCLWYVFKHNAMNFQLGMVVKWSMITQPWLETTWFPGKFNLAVHLKRQVGTVPISNHRQTKLHLGHLSYMLIIVGSTPLKKRVCLKMEHPKIRWWSLVYQV